MNDIPFDAPGATAVEIGVTFETCTVRFVTLLPSRAEIRTWPDEIALTLTEAPNPLTLAMLVLLEVHRTPLSCELVANALDWVLPDTETVALMPTLSDSECCL